MTLNTPTVIRTETFVGPKSAIPPLRVKDRNGAFRFPSPRHYMNQFQESASSIAGYIEPTLLSGVRRNTHSETPQLAGVWRSRAHRQNPFQDFYQNMW